MADNIPPATEMTPEYVDSLKQMIESQTAQISALTDTITEANKPVEPEIKPEDDPENRPFQTPKEVREEMDSRAARITRQELEKIEADRAKVIQEQNDKDAAITQEIDKSLKSAEEAGLLPPILTNEKDNDDLGVKARRELFGLAAMMGTPNLLQVAKQMDALHKWGMFFDYTTGEYAEIPGTAPLPSANGFADPATVRTGNLPTPPADNNKPTVAPVGSSSSKVGGGTPTKPDYSTIHNTSLERLLDNYGK